MRLLRQSIRNTLKGVQMNLHFDSIVSHDRVVQIVSITTVTNGGGWYYPIAADEQGREYQLGSKVGFKVRGLEQASGCGLEISTDANLLHQLLKSCTRIHR